MHSEDTVTFVDGSSVLKLIHLCVLFVAAIIGGFAEASCNEKRAFDQVGLQTKQFLSDGAPLSQAQKHALGSALAQLSTNNVKALLTQNDLTIYGPFVTELLGDLSRLQRGELRNASDLTPQSMRLAAQVFDEVCQSETASAARAEEVTQSRQLGLITFSFESAFRLGNSPDVRSYINLSLVFFLLLGLISMIVFAWKVYAIAYTMLTNRRSCKIPAVLSISDSEISGVISVLGLRAARFLPDSNADGRWLIAHLKQQGVLPRIGIDVKGNTFGVRLHVVQEGFCIAHFMPRLDRDTLDYLFEHSIEPPRYASKRRLKSNMHEINPKFA